MGETDKWKIVYSYTYSDSVLTDDTPMNMTDAYILYNDMCKSKRYREVVLYKNEITVATWVAKT